MSAGLIKDPIRFLSRVDWTRTLISTMNFLMWFGNTTILLMAGIMGIDVSLFEAARMDGANARQTFFRVVFPVMKPINIVIVVITTIESLRAFDLVYITNQGRSPMELLSTLITNNAISESTRIGFGSAIAVCLTVISLVPIIGFLVVTLREDKQ